jgi:hypothetical protein
MDQREVNDLIQKAIQLALLRERKRIAGIIEDAGIIVGGSDSELAEFAERVAEAVRDE